MNASVAVPSRTYWSSFDETSEYSNLNVAERLWLAWYLFVGNDVLATGLLSIAIRELAYFGAAMPWVVIDLIPWFKKYKIQRHKVPSSREQWKCAALVLLYHFAVGLPQIWSLHGTLQRFGIDTGVPFPPLTKMAAQVFVFFVLEDAWHYWCHRALHWGPLYKYVHKLHHQYSAPFGLAAEYASPIETMILGLGTPGSAVAVNFFTRDLHIVTMYLWITLRLAHSIDQHSGYDFPWAIHRFVPLWAGAQHHDLHHEHFVGNYASNFLWWDYLMDTESGPKAAQERRARRAARLAKKTD